MAVAVIGKILIAIYINIVNTVFCTTAIAFFAASLLVLFFNIGIPNELKGCLFFIQVSG